MADEAVSTNPTEEPTPEPVVAEKTEPPTESKEATEASEPLPETKPNTVEEGSKEDNPNVKITEEPTPPTDEPLKEEQPLPIVEEPASCAEPQPAVLPNANTDNNTVITEIAPSEPSTANNVEETPQPPPPPAAVPDNVEEKPQAPPADVLDAALKTAAEKPVPVADKKSSIIRDSEAPDLDPAANTIFILDLMNQRQEKLRRKKKDDMINEMALKMKKEKEEAKRRGRGSASHNFGGGFVGINALISEKPMVGKSPQLHRKVRFGPIFCEYYY